MPSSTFSIRLCIAMLSLACAGSAAATPTLREIMQHPDWIGPPVEAAWWDYGSDSYVYRVKRAGTAVRDHYRSGGAALSLDAAGLGTVDGDDAVVSRDGGQVLSVLEGSLLHRDLRTGELRRLFTGQDPVTAQRFTADGAAALFASGGRWWRIALDGGAATPLADLRFEDAPHAPGDDALELEQLRLFSTLERERGEDEDVHAAAVARARGVAALGPAPWYLGDGDGDGDGDVDGEGDEEVLSAPSADGRYLLLATRSETETNGARDRMPHYVSRSGYVDIEDVRTLVGRDAPRPHKLWLLDLQERTRTAIDLTALRGVDRDPLAALKRAQDIAPHDGDNPRPVEVRRIVWHPTAATALVRVRSIDNKDRWTLRLEAASGEIDEFHRLSDEAWVNMRAFVDFGWIPGSDAAWLLSEESGYGHLYRIDARGRKRALTSGAFEVDQVSFARDGASALLVANREHPAEYDLYRLALEDRSLERLTELRGVERYARHADERRVLVGYSGSYLPTQVAVLDLDRGTLGDATDTRTATYRELQWQAPEFVAVPSHRGAGAPIWSKFYPARGEHDGPRPIVVFVHGAGYTQNTHHKFPYYFREQMFHNLLTERGYHVIDMDYRASMGYGRDWRTAIYRQMGTPELEDLVDGVRWVVAEHDGDPGRVGVYGGSYGGFMTFMAMFNAPDVFAAGASLRPVTDWRHYNHRYTANILNTPQVDPEAHRVSSPIEFAEGLQGHLLISHGMLDDNVFYKDSVRIAQRLIELEKENWELASYPLEPHGYVHPEAWLDQYRRILKLFERTIGDGGPGRDDTRGPGRDNKRGAGRDNE